MPASTGQCAVRLTCVLGLLLLPAVQEKLCIRPVPPQSESCQPASTPGSSQQPKRKAKAPPALAALVPDVVPPRWPNHARLTAVHRARPAAVPAWTNRPLDRDDDGRNVLGTPWALLDPQRRPPQAQPLPIVAASGWLAACPARHVFDTSILRTGPPSV
jgi:hypothetical protein